jgi:hypothetical protein
MNFLISANEFDNCYSDSTVMVTGSFFVFEWRVSILFILPTPLPPKLLCTTNHILGKSEAISVTLLDIDFSNVFAKMDAAF